MDSNLFGWIPPEERTAEQHEAHGVARLDIQDFNIFGSVDESEEKVDLTDLWDHPLVVSAIGKAFTGVHQKTGSCVGAGGGNMLFTLMVLEVIRLGQRELIKVPFWLLPYGRSRYYMGARNRGSGSLGSTFAKAVKVDGYVENDRSGLPMYSSDTSNGFVWGSSTELSWSDGDAQQTMDLLGESRKHLVKTVGDCKNADDVEQAIRSWYPCTNASSLIPNARVESDGEAYGRVSRSGGHQTTFMGVWRHPIKGKRYFKYTNQWGWNWGKKGSCWIPEEDVNAIIRNGGETYAFSDVEGFPAGRIPKDKFNIFK